MKNSVQVHVYSTILGYYLFLVLICNQGMPSFRLNVAQL